MAPAAPGAGNPLIFGILDGDEYTLETIRFTLTTDGTAADRYPRVNFLEPLSAQSFHVAANGPQTASLTREWCMVRGGNAGTTTGGASGFMNVALGEFTLIPRPSSFRLIITNMQAGDTITNIAINFSINPYMTTP